MPNYTDWPPWPVTYSRQPYDKFGEPIHPDVKPHNPEIFRLQSTGGLEFTRVGTGVLITVSDGPAGKFKAEDLPYLAAYILDYHRRLTTGRDEP